MLTNHKPDYTTERIEISVKTTAVIIRQQHEQKCCINATEWVITQSKWAQKHRRKTQHHGNMYMSAGHNTKHRQQTPTQPQKQMFAPKPATPGTRFLQRANCFANEAFLKTKFQPIKIERKILASLWLDELECGNLHGKNVIGTLRLAGPIGDLYFDSPGQNHVVEFTPGWMTRHPSRMGVVMVLWRVRP